jgi:hypothetical protein
MDLANPEILEQLHKLFNDKNWRMNNLYWIKDKRGQKVKFKYNQVQDQYQKNKHNRNVILKARQQGFTTYECLNALDNCLFNSYYDAGIIAHTVDDAEKIFTNKVKFAYDNLPELIKKARKPNTDRAGELRFPNGSSISVSAGYRGGTLMKLHVSEFGKICVKFPDKAREIITGAFNAVPLDGDLTIESTAEGMNGAFYEMCEKSQILTDNLTPMDFKFHFFAWYESSEYRLNPEGIEIPESFKLYFKSLKDNHDIDLDAHQKAWYVKKSIEQDDDMKQEYPSYPEEAFRASGRPVFNLEKLSRDIKRSKLKTPIKGIVDAQGFNEITNGSIHIWKKPVKDEAYAIGADVAEGLVDGDFSTASVLNKNFEQVATYCGHIPPDQFGAMLVNLAKYYNGAILAPEINSIGLSVIEAIKRANYYKVYKREVKEELGQDRVDKIGWHTNIKTKMLMLDDLRAAFRDDVIVINDEATLREMMTLTVEDDGNIEMNSKDRTVALAISIQAIRQASIEGENKAYVPQKSPSKDVTKLSIEDKLKYYKRMNKE